MALPPPPMPPAGGAPPPMSPPGGMAPPAAPGADAGGDDSDVLATVVKNDDGSYTVYSGDEPDAGAGDMSTDDADAMGPAGDAAAPSGQHADSIGAALKMVLDILNADKSSEGAPGSADDQFAAGFSGPQAPTAVGGGA